SEKRQTGQTQQKETDRGRKRTSRRLCHRCQGRAVQCTTRRSYICH
ncbi:hypothetical protein AB1N83_007563, partial [Pleurotus pulmonarius]